jgi:hypothetical protein
MPPTVTPLEYSRGFCPVATRYCEGWEGERKVFFFEKKNQKTFSTFVFMLNSERIAFFAKAPHHNVGYTAKSD